ncbi:hypothetical protein [Hirschia baltica]|uniref:Uncharacterized protein n=1 Tax=Hirschia baltica (strain ATCC 49814 / DSM 5838 / IFAM 1418) TaxID=582402 RepID=C6XPG8_HIRBI|nr:hypothetical protein [Hirschia baltica]ACT58454.1 hypothetical protein Hbal_0760 [Hirschia baltica ATCC 49814]
MFQRTWAFVIVAMLATSVSHAQASETTAEELARCLVRHSDEEIELVMKDFLVNALLENKIEAQSDALKLGMSMSQMAMNGCGLSKVDLQKPVFTSAAELYGNIVGKRIMAKAMSNIGME